MDATTPINAYFGGDVIDAGNLVMPHLLHRHYVELGINEEQLVFLLQLMALRWDFTGAPRSPRLPSAWGCGADGVVVVVVAGGVSAGVEVGNGGNVGMDVEVGGKACVGVEVAVGLVLGSGYEPTGARRTGRSATGEGCVDAARRV